MKPHFFVTLAVLFLAFASSRAEAAVHYVNVAGLGPAAPYLTWSTAATNIQDAVNVSTDGDTVLVTNGIYQTGGAMMTNPFFLAAVLIESNRVQVTNSVSILSVNGPGTTTIRGFQMPGVTNGSNAIRCVYLTNGATLSGFTLTSGATTLRDSGGGAFCGSSSLVANCILMSNAADAFGGGAFGGNLSNCVVAFNSCNNGGGGADARLYNCTVSTNFAPTAGGGVYQCTLTNCTLAGNSSLTGGGAFFGLLVNCTVTSNVSLRFGGGCYSNTVLSCSLIGNVCTGPNGGGGGAASATVNNSFLLNNAATNGGGGTFNCTVNDCVLSGNVAAFGGGAVGGALNHCTIVSNMATAAGGGIDLSTMVVNNSIVYYNTAPAQSNFYLGALTYCCTAPIPATGVGNFTNAPLFVDFGGGDYHLQSNSPCINAGSRFYATNLTDLDGNPRIVAGSPDAGSYEFQTPSSILPYFWAQQNGLLTDGSADFADPDGDGMNNWQEWVSGTSPTNANSVLRILSVTNTGPGLKVTWQCVNSVKYAIQRSTNLSSVPSFISIHTSVADLTGSTSYTDTTATNAGPYYYRIGVQ